MIIKILSERNVIFTHKLDGWDLNIHLIRAEKHNFIIDTGVGSKSIRPVLEYVNRDEKPIIVVNTHYHWDHVFGNYLFENNVIVAHKLCRNLIDKTWEEKERAKEYTVSSGSKKLPNLLFEDVIYFPEDSIRIFHTPGHTIDSISVFDERERILNTGDNIGDDMKDILPNLEAGDLAYVKSIATYKKLAPEICVSGHNSLQDSSVFELIDRQLVLK